MLAVKPVILHLHALVFFVTHQQNNQAEEPSPVPSRSPANDRWSLRSALNSTEVHVTNRVFAATDISAAEADVVATTPLPTVANELQPQPEPLALRSSTVDTPLNPEHFALCLRAHPDREFVSMLLTHIRHGFPLGYTGPREHRILHNLKSAAEHPDVLDAGLLQEVKRGHLAGPFSTPPLPNLQCSGLGVVPKKNGSWRLIMHLSAPFGSSINDGISPNEYRLSYRTVDDAIHMVQQFGPGCLMANMDLKHAFRICPVHPEDWELLGTHWRSQFYVDKRLPFGLRSSPALFNRVADAFEWIVKFQYGISNILHYLDDYFMVQESYDACNEFISSFDTAADRLGIPLAEEKQVGPTQCLTFLGIEFDSSSMSAPLPASKRDSLLADLPRWLDRRKCTKRELQSIIGSLSFACKVVPAGRAFLRRLIDLSTSVKRPHHHIYLNSSARADFQWWLDFLPRWDGVSLFPEEHWSDADHLHLFTDASGTHGFGACFGRAWLRGNWQEFQLLTSGKSIAWQYSCRSYRMGPPLARQTNTLSL